MRSFFSIILPLYFLLIVGPTKALAQASDAVVSPIQDNSFLVEEAYNQERGVVQHIGVFANSFESNEWSFAFTQEWPLWSQEHQFSYSIPLQHSQFGESGSTGVGDVSINYRYQVLGVGGGAALAPRISILLPSGDGSKNLGLGSVGAQFNLPFSTKLSPEVVIHSNAGFTYYPKLKTDSPRDISLLTVTLGQSAIWLLSQNFNVMLEGVYTRSKFSGSSFLDETIIVNPGVRWAHNFDSGLQIVPGISAPIIISDSGTELSVLLYISFEHGF